uniref:Uncharacterized protein n=1 Tax=Oryza meridionalis TaxID=40149 RepID=A0A0E0C7J3_9ORYZ
MGPTISLLSHAHPWDTPLPLRRRPQLRPCQPSRRARPRWGKRRRMGGRRPRWGRRRRMGGRRPLLADDGEPPPPPPCASLSPSEEGGRGGGGGGGWEEGNHFSPAFLAPPSSAIGSPLLLPARRCRCRRKEAEVGEAAPDGRKETEVGEAAADGRKAATPHRPSSLLPRRRCGAPSSSSPRVAVAAGKQKAAVAATGFPSTEHSTKRGGEKE